MNLRPLYSAAFFLLSILWGFLAAAFMADGWFVPSAIFFGFACLFTSLAVLHLFPDLHS